MQHSAPWSPWCKWHLCNLPATAAKWPSVSFFQSAYKAAGFITALACILYFVWSSFSASVPHLLILCSTLPPPGFTFPHRRESMWYLSFWVWIISLNTIISSSFHFPGNFSFFFNGWLRFHFVYAPHFHYPFFCWWVSRLVPFLYYCE